MKKTIKFLQFVFSFSCILLLVSCRNSIGGSIENKTVIFNGSFEVEDSLLRRMESAVYSGSEHSRSAQPSLPASITYYAQATNKDNSSDIIISNDLNESTGTFSIPLKTGAVWIIEVGAKGVSATSPSDSSAVLIKDTFEFNPASATEPRVDHTFYLAPYVSENGKGYLNLQMQIENPKGNKISIVEIIPKRDLSDESKTTAEWNSVANWIWDSGILSYNSTSVLDTNSTAIVPIQKNNFPSGFWEVAINFTDEEGQLLFSSTQIICVYDNLETKTWESSKTTVASNELIKNGVFRLTTQLVDSYGLTDFYVGGTNASDENSGSPNKPFAKISKAISIVNGINRMDKTYAIHIKNGVSESCSTQLLVQSNVSIECYNTSYGDKKGIATITSTSSDAILKIEPSEGGICSSLTIEGVKQENSWTGLKLKSGTASYRSPNQRTRGVSVSGGSSFFMNGGEISGNTITSAGNKGAGVYVETDGYFSMSGGIITSNVSSGLGGGVYVAENADFIMKGGSITGNKAVSGGGVYVAGTMSIGGTVFISENGTNASPSVASNIYLPTDKLIKINGKLQTSDANRSTIGVTTEVPPTIGNNIRFTEGYAYGKEWSQNKNDDGTYIHPFKYFYGDVSGCSILTDPTPENPETPEFENNGDAYLGISGGTIAQYTVPEEAILFSFYHQSNKIKITITCTDTEWSGSDSTNTHIFLKKNGAEIPESFWSHNYTGNNEIEVTLGDTLPAGSYVIEIDVSYGSYVYTGICRCTK